MAALAVTFGSGRKSGATCKFANRRDVLQQSRTSSSLDVSGRTVIYDDTMHVSTIDASFTYLSPSF